MYRKFTVRVAEDEELFTSITYDPAESILYFDRSYSGFMHYILFSVEVFVNDGEQTMSNTIYTRQSADGISFEADGGTAVIDVEKYMIEL